MGGCWVEGGVEMGGCVGGWEPRRGWENVRGMGECWESFGEMGECWGYISVGEMAEYWG